MPPIERQALIAASPAQVFAVLCDLDRYPEWNRFTPRLTLASKDLRVGAELDLDCQMTDTELLRGEREVILALDHEAWRFAMGTSRTRGRPGIRSERWQVCEALPDGQTGLRNWERFSGPLAPLVWALYAKKLGRAFERYCADLKARVEGQR